MQLGWPLPLIVDAHSERAREIPSRIGNLLRKLAPDDSVLRRVPHLELASCDLRGGDNFKIGDWHEVPDFQLALAHNRQGRRLHAANADYSPRAPPQDDGCGAGERQVVDLICLPARDPADEIGAMMLAQLLEGAPYALAMVQRLRRDHDLHHEPANIFSFPPAR